MGLGATAPRLTEDKCAAFVLPSQGLSPSATSEYVLCLPCDLLLCRSGFSFTLR